ncbi:RNA polymerase sigma factor [Phytohabitans kaempferiae]|uniref:RNA polymerase sigma factor n=1 Tax=Phytohabitans kaempferiae TaxID=1620943 RepID=A0ABV6M7J5_9ACTN
MSANAEDSDADLLRAVADGDEGALRLLFDRHAPWLAARLRRRCPDPDAVDDVLQDTFVAVWKGAKRWRGDGEAGAWLWGIAARRLISRLRRCGPTSPPACPRPDRAGGGRPPPHTPASVAGPAPAPGHSN